MATTIFNDYTVNPRNLTLYNAFRGVTDFTNINQFAQFESGYQLLFVLQMPYFMEQLDEVNGTKFCDSFKHMLEYEFRGMDGLPDISSDTMEITDGINTQRLINRVTMDTNTTVSMPYYEKSGMLITKFSEMYLTGIKDKSSQAKTYHGLIRDGKITDPGPDKEIFTMLYIVTDNTMLRVERAVLLANCQLTKADTSNLNGNRSDINNKEVNIEFNTFPIMNNMVDKAAKSLLDSINAATVNLSKDGSMFSSITPNANKAPDLKTDSTEYKYGIMHNNAGDGVTAGSKNDILAYGKTTEGTQFINALQ